MARHSLAATLTDDVIERESFMTIYPADAVTMTPPTFVPVLAPDRTPLNEIERSGRTHRLNNVSDPHPIAERPGLRVGQRQSIVEGYDLGISTAVGPLKSFVAFALEQLFADLASAVTAEFSSNTICLRNLTDSLASNSKRIADLLKRFAGFQPGADRFEMLVYSGTRGVWARDPSSPSDDADIIFAIARNSGYLAIRGTAPDR